MEELPIGPATESNNTNFFDLGPTLDPDQTELVGNILIREMTNLTLNEARLTEEVNQLQAARTNPDGTEVRFFNPFKRIQLNNDLEHRIKVRDRIAARARSLEHAPQELREGNARPVAEILIHEVIRLVNDAGRVDKELMKGQVGVILQEARRIHKVLTNLNPNLAREAERMISEAANREKY